MVDLTQIKSILQASNFRVTQSRLAVAQTLLHNKDKLLSSDEIYHKIKSDATLSCDQVSVYRALATFEKLKLVKKSCFHGDAARYALSAAESNESSHHEHFFKCIQCSVIEPFEGCFVSKKEKELETIGYRQLNHHLEITGICPGCAN